MRQVPPPRKPEEPVRWWLAVLVFLSAYAPLPVLVAPRYLSLARTEVPARSVIAAGVLVVVASALGLWVALRSLRGNRVVHVTGVQAKPGDLLAYAILYVASFVGFDSPGSRSC